MLKNRVQLVRNYYLKRDDFNLLPTELIIEPTNRCNLKCTMCPIGTGDMTRPIEYMEFSLFEKLVEEVKGHVEILYLHGLGEPLFHPELTRMVSLCTEKGIRTCISTNSTNLTDEKSKALIRAGLSMILLPMDGATKETYESIRVNANFDKVVRNIRHFLAVKKEMRSDIYTTIQMIVQKENEEEVKMFQEMWRGVEGVDCLRTKPVVDFTNEGRGDNFMKNTVLDKPCYYLWHQGSVAADGSVELCCMDNNGEMNVGSLKDGSLAEMWNSDKMKEIRRLHAQGRGREIPFCANCGIPQPSHLGILGTSVIDNYHVKRLLPKYEYFAYKLADN